MDSTDCFLIEVEEAEDADDDSAVALCNAILVVPPASSRRRRSTVPTTLLGNIEAVAEDDSQRRLPLLNSVESGEGRR